MPPLAPARRDAVRLRGGPALRLVSAKAWLHRFTFALLVGATLALMMLGRSDSALVERARVVLLDAVAPLMNGVARPLGGVRHIYDQASELLNLRRENAMLRQEQDRLLQWQSVARKLAAENEALRNLLKFVPDRGASFVTARVVADTGGAFVRSVLVAAGARDGLRKGDAAATGEGLVGRVAEVGAHSARVLLLTDINSRIPVVIERSRDQGILAGDNSDNPRLLYLSHGTQLSPGDRIVTSAAGGAFPPGLPVGFVKSIEGGDVVVQLFVDWDHMEYLRLMNYHLPGVLQDDREGRH
jgi:rod shape-determining protein MreC